MSFCSRCNAKLHSRDYYCPVCGLHRKGGKGRISLASATTFHECKETQGEHLDPDKILSEIPNNIKFDKVWEFYDLESLTQEKVDSELKRLHKEIEELENALIYMEEHEQGHPDKMKFYEERINLRAQLDALYNFLSNVEQERIDDFIKNTDLEIKYGTLPNWRKKQLMKKKASEYYHLKF